MPGQSAWARPTSLLLGLVAGVALLLQRADAIASWAVVTDPNCANCCTAGGTFTTVQFTFTMSKAVANLNTLRITASGTIFNVISDLHTGCSGSCIVTFTDAGTAQGTDHTMSTTGTYIDIAPKSGKTLGDDSTVQTIILKLSGSVFTSITASGTAITFAVDDTGAVNFGTALTAGAGWNPDSGTTCGDPLTFFNGKKTKFWIPFGYSTPLLKTADVHILAKPIPGPEEDHQWFGSMQLTLPSGSPILEVTALLKGQENMSARTRQFFRSRELDVELLDSGLQLTRTRENPRHGQVPRTLSGHFGTLDGKIRGFVYKHAYGNGESADVVYIKTPSVSFSIMSSIAGHEFPSDPVLQEKYRHLDLGFLDAPQGYRTCAGLLPELWEEIPCSEEARITTIAPSNRSEAESRLLEAKVWDDPKQNPFKICSE